MGHHATYRKRGTAKQTTQGLVRPAPPTLTTEPTNLIATSSFANNAGGVSHLYHSEDGGITYYPYGEHVWAQVMDWGATDGYDLGLYYATSEGNGVDYVNESDPSNIISIGPE